MNTSDTGGPAFPPVHDPATHPSGMTLRDYFAIHSTQPGMAEICKAAGVEIDSMHRVHLSKYGEGMHFDGWWTGMTLEQQCELSAKVRYAQSDAMLKVRNA